jgi:hypothetical protein
MSTPKRRFLLLTLLLLLAGLVGGGCEAFGAGDDDDDPGIVFGEHIAGVTLAAGSTDVRSTLGTPDEFVRGDFPSVTYRYTDGAAAGLEVEIATDSLEVASPGEVVTACAYAPYDGKTEEGVGVGTPREKAHRLLGMPEDTLSSAWTYRGESGPQGWYDEYYFGNGKFRVEYRADEKVRSICVEPYVDDGYMITNAKGSVESIIIDDSTRLFGIRPDFTSKTSRFGGKGKGVPEAFQQDSLRVVFSAWTLPLPSGRMVSLPIRLVSIEKLE